ncbi:MAG: glycosyl transferase group 1, partial [Bryobacterales bacterium]|nr:glycosyl transferase group 1 [Bryobacterales bacterium]
MYSPTRADKAFLNGAERLRAHAIPIHHRPHVGDILSGLRLRSYVRRHGPFDAIHAHSTKAGLLARTALAGLPGKLIYTPHAPLTMDPGLKPFSRLVLAAYEKLLARWTDRIVTVSPEEFDHLHRLGIWYEKLSLVPNGIDVIEARRDPNPNPGRPLCVGFMGRLARQKNLPMLLESFARVLVDSPQPAVLAIAGTGPMEPALRAQATRLGIESSVRWLGECDPSILNSFDVFALPSLYEGLPYVLLESMAAGLPIVSTRVGGTSLSVREGVNGFVVPVNNVKAFANALGQLVRDPELRRAMGAASRERVEAFTISRMV